MNGYAVQMKAVLAQLLLLVSVLLMPLGMSAAPAAVPHHADNASAMPMEHCPDRKAPKDQHRGFAECTMACAAALPAADARPSAGMALVCTPERPETAEQLPSLAPETATPPPKRS